MSSDQFTLPTIEVLLSRDELSRAIEAITGDSSEAVLEGRLRREIEANHPSLSEMCDEPEEAVQIFDAIERDLLDRDNEEGLLRLNDSAHSASISETRIR
jgi:hypothetical protein